jgi:hypothetical protein
VQGLCIDEVFTTPHSSWQNPFVERLIGWVRACASTISSFLAKQQLRRPLTATLRTITAHARISSSTGTRPTGGSSKARRPAGSYHFAKSVASIHPARPAIPGKNGSPRRGPDVVLAKDKEAFGLLGFTFRWLRSPRGSWWVQKMPAMRLSEK